MMKRLLIGLSLLVVTAGMPIAPAIAQSDSFLEKMKAVDKELAEKRSKMTPEEQKAYDAGLEAMLEDTFAQSTAQRNVDAALKNGKPEGNYSGLGKGEKGVPTKS